MDTLKQFILPYCPSIESLKVPKLPRVPVIYFLRNLFATLGDFAIAERKNIAIHRK